MESINRLRSDSIKDSLGWWKSETKLCSPEELDGIIDASNSANLPTDPYNKIDEGIYISDGVTAKNLNLLKTLKITHVLNAACGDNESLDLINTSQEYYDKAGIKFMGLEAIDISTFNLFAFFYMAADFIEDALDEGGNILVHCKLGTSRSPSLVLAYLMIKKGYTIQNAVRTLATVREIRPNMGFLKQLCFLNDLLKSEAEGKSALDLE